MIESIVWNMPNKNLQRKKEIEKIVAEFATKFSVLKKKRDDVVTNFLEALKEKKLDELRKALQQL